MNSSVTQYAASTAKEFIENESTKCQEKHFFREAANISGFEPDLCAALWSIYLLSLHSIFNFDVNDQKIFASHFCSSAVMSLLKGVEYARIFALIGIFIYVYNSHAPCSPNFSRKTFQAPLIRHQICVLLFIVKLPL